MLLLPCLLAMQLAVLTREPEPVLEPFSATITIRHDDNYDPRLSYFRLAFSDGTHVILIGDDDLRLIQWLKQNANARVPLQIGK